MNINNSDIKKYVENTHYNIITNRELNVLWDRINSLINEYFNKLILSHKKILIKYLYKLIIIFSNYYYTNNFIEQLYLNNYQDIFSLLVLLMPFYDLNKSKEMLTLDELFLNQNNQAKKLESSYYIDHLELSDSYGTENYLKKYFESSLICVNNTLSQIHCLILPNWCNIFPHTLASYKTSDLYKNFEYLYEKKSFSLTNSVFQLIDTEKHTDYDFQSETNFKLGYPILYGTVYSFLYSDIKNIKWMIYDLNIDKKLIPNIIYLGKMLKISNINFKPWNKLVEIDKSNFIELWNSFVNSSDTNQVSLRSLVLFYLRWEKDNNTLKKLNISKKCLELIEINLESVYDENTQQQNTNDENVEFKIYSDDELDKCLKVIYKFINFDKIYNYIYDCIQKFRYTWYGYCCLDEQKNILSEDNFFEKYFLSNPYIRFGQKNNQSSSFGYLDQLHYITPKNIYNFCKSLIHIKNVDKYECLSLEPKWNNMLLQRKVIFIERLNSDKKDMVLWFNIINNLKKSYQGLNKINQYDLMDKYINVFTTTNLFVNIIFQTLVYNGMLSYYKFNPIMTDSKIIPNKNTQYKEWESYILTNIDINSYIKSYHAFSNTMLETHGDNLVKTIINSKWYTNFGASWIAQIQVYHHYNSNRVIFITGATGAGKSTVTPFLLVYAVKIINFNNNAKVVCTQPRTQPVKDNSEQISKSIGLPIQIKKNDDLDNIDETYKKTSIGEGVIQDINYIQYKHKNGNLTDDLYHPYLRLYTDGSLYNIIKQNYIFKKSIPNNTNNINDDDSSEFTSSNIFDIILVDEAHEHNTNMDMILTLSKYAVYINNQVTLGIISATMDDDEIIYRRYFHPIDDNWKYPFDITFLYEFFKSNKNFIDRRIHLSIPFGGMNFDVKEYPNNTSKYPISVGTFTNMQIINKKVIEILKHILNTTPKGDILIFQPGESDIKKLLIEINKQTSSNVLAIPFYSKLDKPILENVVKKIASIEVRNSIRYPKNKYDITDIYKIPPNELMPLGTYNRFVVIATNIAEASITIDSLEFVIDTGNQKVSVFDPDTNQDNLETREIAVPNQKQRKGRVGRVKPGSVYYTYDRTKLGEKVVYKMNIENINSFILDLVTSSSVKLIDSETDPYKTNNLDNIPEFLKKQYSYLHYDNTNNKFIEKLFDYKQDGFGKEKTANIDIIYPYLDGKYKLETLEDDAGKLFIVHPGEDYFIRDPKTLIITSKKPNYFNKVTKAFIYGKAHGMISNTNLLTSYGKLINSIVDFMEFSDNSVDFTRIILDCFSFNLDINSDTFKNILLFIVFKTITLNFKVSNYLVGKADFLIYSSMIRDDLYTKISFEQDIFPYLNNQLNNLQELININVNKFVDLKSYGGIENNQLINQSSISSKLSLNIEEIKKALCAYLNIKFKIEIIKYNSKFIIKSTFDELVNEFDKIFLQKQTDKNVLPNYFLIFINKFIKYYTRTDKYMKTNVILQLVNELDNNISENDTNTNSKSHTNKIIQDTKNKIINMINNTSIYENEFLKKINLINNKTYSQKLISDFNLLTNYDKLCFLIIKNFPQNIVVKIPETQFYVEYFKKDINRIYGLEKNTFKLNDKKSITFLSTKVPGDIRNYYIFAVNINDDMNLTNIMFLSEYVINLLNNYFTEIKINLFSKNLTYNFNELKEKYQSKPEIIEKIDKIIKYIRDN